MCGNSLSFTIWVMIYFYHYAPAYEGDYVDADEQFSFMNDEIAGVLNGNVKILFYQEEMNNGSK